MMNRTTRIVTDYLGLATVGQLDLRGKQLYIYMLELRFFVSFCCLAAAVLGIYATVGPALRPWKSVILPMRPNVPALVISPSKSASSPSYFRSNDLGALPDAEGGYMLYAPHSGFGNQARELSNALKIAFVLNRTLVIPPILNHFELKHGQCLNPSHPPRDLRKRFWEALVSRFDISKPQLRPYVSIADVLNLSSIKSMVKTIDYRVFLVLLCGMDISTACSGPVCHEIVRNYLPSGSVGKNMKRSCASKLFPEVSNSRSRPSGNDNSSKDVLLEESSLVYEVDQDCRSVVWTYNEPQDWASALQRILMDLLRADKSKLRSIPSRHMDRASVNIVRKDLFLTFGPPSQASRAPILSFGSMFSTVYRNKDMSKSWPHVEEMTLLLDINSSQGDQPLQKALQAIQYQPFSKHILNAATYFLKANISGPFFCAHVRLEDGAFVGKQNQETKIFLPLQAKLDSLISSISKRRISNHGSQTMDKISYRPLNIFLMTDRKRSKWNSSRPLHDLTVNPLYKIHTLDGMDSLLRTAARETITDENGLTLGFVPHTLSSAESPSMDSLEISIDNFDTRLFVEEVVCSCATLGFQGTAGSTISGNINNLREANMCPLGNTNFTLD